MTPTNPTPAVVRYLPWVCVAVAGLYLLSIFGRMNPPKEPYNLDAFARLPVVDGGRVKPLETVARLYLRSISGRESAADDKGEKVSAIQWYLDVLATGGPDQRGAARKYKVFRIDNEQVLTDLNLKPNADLRYSLDEFAPRFEVLISKSAAAHRKRQSGAKLDLYETKVLELADKVQLSMNLNRFKGKDRPDNKLLMLPPQAAGADWQSLGEYREEALTESLVSTMLVAQRALLASGRLDLLTPDDEKALLKQFDSGDVDRVPPQQRAMIVKKLLEMFRGNPRDVPPDGRREWLEAVFSLLPAGEDGRLRQLLKKDADARLAANPAAVAWDGMVAAYRDGKPAEFNRILAEYPEAYLQHLPGKDFTRVRLEVMYDRFAPFYHCLVLYVMVFLLSVTGFVLNGAEKPAWGGALRLSASRVLYLTLVVHTVALLVRMYLMDRPFVFVTNLYSSAIFIGWGCVAIGMVLERLYPIGVGNVIAAVLGLATTIVAHNLATDDTLEMMQAVLDTNFWLSTHVTTVTLGYTATFVAGFLGAAYVFQMLAAVIRESFLTRRQATPASLLAFGTAAGGVVAIPLLLVWFLTTALAKFELIHASLPSLVLFVTAAAAVVYAISLLFLKATADQVDAHGNALAGTVPGIARPLAGMGLTAEGSKTLGQMTYGVICFATLLSFVGTVLGGIWADQSWGRFWGWDPKENGAVLIVLWNALILHARWCGLIRDRGVAVLAIFGNMITAWSWFGTNQLGIGLHAYGFDTRLADGCTNFWASQLVIMGLGLIPATYWATTAARPAAAPRPDPVAPAPNGQADGHPASTKKTAKRR